MRLLPGTKKFDFRTIVLTQAQPRSRLFVCLFRIPSFSAPAPPNRLRYPGTRLLRPIRFSGSLPALRPRSTASAFFRPANRAFRLHRRHLLLRHPRTASGIPAPVCSVRFAFPEASRPCAPDRPQAPFSGPRIVPSACTAALFAPGPPNRFRYPGTRLLRPEQDGRERLRPSGRSAAASGGPAGRPTPAGRGTAIPPRRSQTGRFPSTAASASRRTTPGSGTDGAYRCV